MFPRLTPKETGEFEGQFDVSSGFFGGGAWAAIFVEQRLDMDPWRSIASLLLQTTSSHWQIL